MLTGDEMIFGAPDAPVVFMEYACPTARPWAWWRLEDFPLIRSLYIDTGRVRVALMECLTGGSEYIAEDCFLLMRAAGQSGYFPVLEAILEKQDDLNFAEVRGEQYREILWSIAQTNGISGIAFTTALSDPPARKTIQARAYRNSWGSGVDCVPSFVIGDRYFPGRQKVEILIAAIDEAERNALRTL